MALCGLLFVLLDIYTRKKFPKKLLNKFIYTRSIDERILYTSFPYELKPVTTGHNALVDVETLPGVY